MTDAAALPVARVEWPRAVRIIRSLYPPIDLFEDIADPADWAMLISAEQKTNPRLMETIGKLDLVPPDRRAGGPGASRLMAPFTHVSVDRPGRFHDGHRGALYVGRDFETALFETIHHHGRFMARTHEVPGWTSQFREILIDIAAEMTDLREIAPEHADILAPDDYAPGQALAAKLRGYGIDGIVYPSVRNPGSDCAALFYPDLARNPTQGRHLDYHWNGARVDLCRDAGSGQVFRIG